MYSIYALFVKSTMTTGTQFIYSVHYGSSNPLQKNLQAIWAQKWWVGYTSGAPCASYRIWRDGLAECVSNVRHKTSHGFFQQSKDFNTHNTVDGFFEIRRSPVDYRYPAFWTDTYPIPKVGTFEDADYLFPVWNGYVLPFRWRVGNFIPQFTKVSRDFWSILSPPNAGLQRNIYPRSFWKSQHSWICFFWWLEEIG